jgi:ornithine cyclodeaminase
VAFGRSRRSAPNHITAVAADGGRKQAWEPELFALAALRVADRRRQFARYGDSSFELERGSIRLANVVDLGQVIQNADFRRRRERDITVGDLTGVAVQDITIAQLGLERLQTC